MNEDTKFLLERMDAHEAKMMRRFDGVMNRLDTIEGWKNRLAGKMALIALAAGIIFPVLVEVAIRKFL